MTNPDDAPVERSSSSKGKNKGKTYGDRKGGSKGKDTEKGKGNVKGKNQDTGKGAKAGKGGKVRDAPGGKGKDRSVRPRNWW